MHKGRKQQKGAPVAKRAPKEEQDLSDISGQEELDIEGSYQEQPEHNDEGDQEHMIDTDAGLAKSKISEIFTILDNFASNPNPNMTKVHYFIELRKLYCSLFGYSEELMEYLMSLFGPRETLAFIEAMDEPRPVTIRVNSLKAKRKDLAETLAERQVNLEPLDEICKTCLKVNFSKVPIGATPEYLAGHYMLQSAASMLPVLALAPQPGDRVLDMAAAPGGKTTHIAQLMRNDGVIVANDVSKNRLKGLFYNCQRLGVKNVIVTNYDGRKFPECLKNFDRVLLDAPCTGLGVISRDQTIKAKRSVLDIKKAAHLQRELLRAAIDRCKVGGYVVYSTCSIAFEENEAVVDYACRKRYVKIVDTGLNIESKVYRQYKETQLPERIKKCVRVFPHVHNLDGFFVAKLLKVRDGPREEDPNEAEETEEPSRPEKQTKNDKKSKSADKFKQAHHEENSGDEDHAEEIQAPKPKKQKPNKAPQVEKTIEELKAKKEKPSNDVKKERSASAGKQENPQKDQLKKRSAPAQAEQTEAPKKSILKKVKKA